MLLLFPPTEGDILLVSCAGGGEESLVPVEKRDFKNSRTLFDGFVYRNDCHSEQEIRNEV